MLRIFYNSSLYNLILKVTRVVLLWVNNHFTDFETDPDMMEFLEKFEACLEKEVSVASSWIIYSGILYYITIMNNVANKSNESCCYVHSS